MKKLLLIYLITSPFVLHAQWNAISQGIAPAGILGLGGASNVYLSAASNIGSNPNIAYSHSEGVPSQSWQYFTTEYASEYFFDMDFISDSVGFICGGGWFSPHRNIVLRTQDAGQSWQTMTRDTFGDGYVFTNIDFVNADSGFISSEYSTNNVFRTTDGGSTWAEVMIDTGFHSILDIQFLNSQLGFVSTQSDSNNARQSRIYRTTDFGNSWQMVYEGNGYYNMYKIHFVNNLIAYVSGAHGSLMKTIDGGNTWSSQYLWPYNDLTALYFVNENEGYANLGGTIQKTNDGGLSWSQQIMSTPNIVSDIRFTPSATIGYLLAGGILYKTTNAGGPTKINLLNLNEEIQVYPNPSKGFVKLTYNEGVHIEQLQLIDLSGKVLKIFDKHLKTLGLAEFAKSVYFLKIETNKGVLTKKIILE